MISVVCPFFNESDIVEVATASMAAALSRDFANWELILVNDGSVDTSKDRLLAFLGRQQDRRIRLLSYSANQGRGRALRTGIKAARGDIIVTTEIDLSWGDDIVARLVAKLSAEPNCHFAIASPHLAGGGFDAVPARRILLTRFGNKLISMFFGSGVTMHTGMTRAYWREVIQPLETQQNGKEFHLEVLLKLVTMGFRAAEIPATISWAHRKAAAGSAPKQSRRSPLGILKTISTHLSFLAIAQPMRYFGILSAIALAAAFGFAVAAVWELLIGGVAAFFALVAMMLLLFCLLFAGFAVAFVQLRELAREGWQKSYPQRPPSALPGDQIYPLDR